MNPDATIHGVLIDISGVLLVDGEPLPGAPEAMRRLRDAGLPLRFVTNTTRRPPLAMTKRLRDGGFDAEDDEMFSAPKAALDAVTTRGLRPWLLVHNDLRPMFDAVASSRPEDSDAVVVGDAGDGFSYAALNDAFSVLMRDDAPLIAMGVNRYFRRGDGTLALDAGPFVRALEMAAETQAEVVGKPSAGLFNAALDSMGVETAHAVMIGDDARDDVGGAQACGLRGVLVRTGKYTPGDDEVGDVPPDAVCDDFAAAVDWILG